VPARRPRHQCGSIEVDARHHDPAARLAAETRAAADHVKLFVAEWTPDPTTLEHVTLDVAELALGLVGQLTRERGRDLLVDVVAVLDLLAAFDLERDFGVVP